MKSQRRMVWIRIMAHFMGTSRFSDPFSRGDEASSEPPVPRGSRTYYLHHNCRTVLLKLHKRPDQGNMT